MLWGPPLMNGGLKIDFNMEALSISCRNKHWSQYLNRILFTSTGYLTIFPAVVVQAVLDSRAACTTTSVHIVRWLVDENNIRLKYCDQCLFLQLMLSTSILKSIFEIRTWITKVHTQITVDIIFKQHQEICVDSMQ